MCRLPDIFHSLYMEYLKFFFINVAGLPVDLFFIWATIIKDPQEFAQQKLAQTVSSIALMVYGSLAALGEAAVVLGGLAMYMYQGAFDQEEFQ